ncbi:MAG: tetratricopeptide repeat protein [Pseudomonadota bacterium]
MSHGYTTRDVADLLGLTPQQIRAFARDGILGAERGGRGEYRYTFQDVVLLRAAKELFSANISAARIRRALQSLVSQLPRGRPLSAVRIHAEGEQVTVREAGVAWHPESGQTSFDFDTADMARQLRPAAQRVLNQAESAATLSAEEWFELGLELDAVDPQAARDAYERALALAPRSTDAHINLGRLCQEQSRFEEAEAHYRSAIRVDADEATAHFNLATLYEDQEDWGRAEASYRAALEVDRDFADAHFNLARVYERLGRTELALRHLRRFQRLQH